MDSSVSAFRHTWGNVPVSENVHAPSVTDVWLTPVCAVSGPSGLWRGVHVVKGQEVKALQRLLCVRVLTGVHAGRQGRGRGVLSHHLQWQNIEAIVFKSQQQFGFSCVRSEDERRLVPYSPGLHVSPVSPLAILFLVFIAQLSCGVLN